jgi:ADP-ribose pyrophosphatase YjhB (NUDIX family)
MKRPRVIVRAVIVEDGNLLVNNRGNRLSLFGGRVEAGETCKRALERELDEELGLRIEVGRLALVIENFFIEEPHRRVHELGFYFAARRKGAAREDAVEAGMAPLWLPLAEVPGSLLYPRVLRELVGELDGAEPTRHLVDVDRVAFPDLM